ncbi:hypothetical protein [Vreelandella aquamarina]|uniref:DUF1351 domain-containing protein n=1 Tax=Vreelandella aquamarina TaxID=77097 RepID=A0A6F8SVG4_9GAMM|nr:hypothetical protein [Halomonas meridiana]BCA91927.1 hypothetical protein HMSLTHF_17020 [Halomonas meridiana]
MTNAAPKTDYKGELVKLDAVEQALAGLREKYGTVPDMQTKEGYDLCKKGIKELTTYRTSTDKLRKEITKPHRDFIDRVNQYGKDLIEKLEAIEKPLKDAKQHEDERAEREKQQRIAKLRERIQVEILSYKDTAVGLDSNALAELHDEAVNINTDGYFDVTKEAEDAKAEVLQHIIEMHGRTLEKERLAAEQAEVEAERRRLREENEKREADQKELEELRRFKAEQEAKRNPAPQPQPKPEPEPAPLPAAAEHKPLNASRLSAAADSYSKSPAPASKPETVTISRSEYDQLLAAQAKLRALEAMGVVNWSGYEQAMQQLAA